MPSRDAAMSENRRLLREASAQLDLLKIDNAGVRQRQATARGIWNASVSIEGTIAETYLREARAISIPLPGCLRFDPGIKSRGVPAVVAAVLDPAGDVVAIHRTFLKPDGTGTNTEMPARALGPAGWGAVRLAPAGVTLGLVDRIEVGLAAMQLFRLPVWCAVGSNLARLILPRHVRQIVIFANRGAASEGAAEKARRAFHYQRRKVAVRMPAIGVDFNDEIRARARG